MQKPQILFIHGMWGTSKVWENYAPRFETAGYETSAVTLRLHDSPIAEPAPEGLGTTSLLDYVDDVVKTVDAMVEKGASAPVLVGHSMGGLIAQLVAARTDNVKAVIALTPAPPAGVFALKLSTIKIFKKILLTPRFWKKPTRLTWEAAYQGVYNGLPEAEAKQHFADNVWDSGRATFEIAFWTMDRTKAAKLDRDNINCPVLILSGADDLTVNASVVRASAKKYKGANAAKLTYENLPGYSHWVLGGAGWEKIADRCLDWLKLKANS
ncbi:MAG: alpha/beta hydrolase [Robiginitomaculum sp.]|nr:alpha/beta hydrolase [Robiginitomaculum sp.]